MVVAARVLAFLAGAAVVVGVLGSAMRTVVVPRAEPTLLTQTVFVSVRKIFDLRVRKKSRWEDADRLMARYAPICLLLLPAVWVTGVLIGLTPMFWALGSGFPREA